jgi:hypothetical protein
MKLMQVIVLCPVKNEAWILERFLATASCFADHILIADQQSSDTSRAICSQYPKVTLIENTSSVFNEPERQKLLIEKAREIPGSKLLLALDADEILTANILADLPEWNTVMSSPPGTVIEFERIMLWKSPLYYNTLYNKDGIGEWFAVGYVDDGAKHHGQIIHSPRVPIGIHSPRLRLHQIKIMHYQFCDWERALSKHRFYRCFERAINPRRSPTEIHRLYDIHPVEIRHLCPSRVEWFRGWEERGIDVTTIIQDVNYWWDWEVLKYIADNGVQLFRNEDIWSVDWETKRQAGLTAGREGLPVQPVKDPRNKIGRILMKIRRRTQHTKYQSAADFFLRIIRQ